MKVSRVKSLAQARSGARGPSPRLTGRKGRPAPARKVIEPRRRAVNTVQELAAELERELQRKRDLCEAAKQRWQMAGPDTRYVRFSHEGKRYVSSLTFCAVKICDSSGRVVTGYYV